MTTIKPRLWHTMRQHVSDLVRRQSMVQKLAAEHGYTLRVLNDGQHWEFKRLDLVVEWWPSTGRMMLDKRADIAKTYTFDGLRSALKQFS